MSKQKQEQPQQEQPQQEQPQPCPNCGHFPTCGHQPQRVIYVTAPAIQPFPAAHIYPGWWSVSSPVVVTSGVTISVRTSGYQSYN